MGRNSPAHLQQMKSSSLVKVRILASCSHLLGGAGGGGGCRGVEVCLLICVC